jgi:hypothetical protein
MATQECPLCHSRVSLAGQQLYCMNCGWNRDAAISSLRMSLNMTPVAALMFVGFLAFMIFGWHFRNPGQIAIFACVPAAGILLNYVSTKGRLAKLQALPTPALRPATGSADRTRSQGDSNASVASAVPSAQDQALLRTPTPREIRLASRGKFNLAIMGIVVLTFATIIGAHLYGVWARTLSFATFGQRDWIATGFALLLLLIPFGMWRGQVRECDLLENGEIAIATVTNQWASRDNSSVEYEFQDYQGQTHKVLGFDLTKKVYRGMTIPVFYDRDNPKRQIAYCSTLHEIVT